MSILQYKHDNTTIYKYNYPSAWHQLNIRLYQFIHISLSSYNTIAIAVHIDPGPAGGDGGGGTAAATSKGS